MKHELEFKGFEPAPALQSLIDSRIAHLDRKVKGLSADPLFLRCSVEEVPVHTLFRVSATLDVPQKTLAAKRQTHDPEQAVREVFEDLERQLEEYKSKMRGEQWWKRVERRRELHALKGAQPAAVTASSGAADEQPQWFLSLVQPHLEKLREVAGHVIRYLQARGDLPPGELETDDVVDAAIARAYDVLSKDRARKDVRSLLVRFALDEIKSEVKRLTKELDAGATVEDYVPPTPPELEAWTLGDEILDFYQPGEDVNVEDILPDIEVAPPDQEFEAKEMRQCVRTALRGLSREARSALTLRYVVGLHGKELARALRKTEREVAQLIESARGELRRELVRSGCVLTPAGQATT